MNIKIKEVLRKLGLLARIPLKQEVLLKEALFECNIDYENHEIVIDHSNGFNYVDGFKFTIKYPRSFYDRCEELLGMEKDITYYFNGFINKDGGRERILSPFMSKENSLVINSSYGRMESNKDKFNIAYYSGLASSRFALCPHHTDWTGNWENNWTYRFIEACFTGAIPILFREAPLGLNFIEGFYYYWDNEVVTFQDLTDKEISDMAHYNRDLALLRFCFSESDLANIKKDFMES